MRFTLTYTGRLASRGDAKTKHAIRLKLHSQLKELWATHPALADEQQYISRVAPDGPANEGSQALSLTEIGGYDFAALVHPALKLYAELDILVLRPEPPGSVLSHSGDIDNQLKTLFDALRRPAEASEIPRGWTPGEGQDPLHCLLDDDKWITRVSVETDRLLIPPIDPTSQALVPEEDGKVVQAIIRVTMKGFTATWGNLGMIG